MSDQVADVCTKYLVEAAKNAVPTGYKQTEVGVIPEDWQLSNIRDVSAIPMQNGLFYEPKRKGKGVPLINVGDMYTAAPVDVDSLELFNATAGEIKVFRVERGDLFFTRSSVVPSGIAYCNIFDSEREDVVFDSHLIRVRPNTEILEPRYLYLNCIAKHSRTALIAEAKTATMTTIDQGAINRCPVLVPPKKEQTAIANALSDVDALISELEKLIAKKQAIKTATMQQLLTGRTRLPQFALREDGTPKSTKPSELGDIPEDWEVVAMGSLGSFGRGRVISHTEINRAVSKLYPVYSSQTSNEGVMGYIDTYDFEGEFVTWTTDGVNAGKVFYRNGRFNCTNVCGVISVSSCDANYIAIAMGAESRKYVSTNLANPKLMNGEAKQVLIKKPNEVAEQTAIATILSDMDAEIQALEQRLGKTRQIKQGMMQELLTGKTRLVQPSLTGVCHAD
ncbi:restriction endonuclease subunit S [Vibrio vulnificus]|uniref:restriction endonuclease subunit S n=1 Tax=Vibrio vulnificus TaxID=672 RepID=UPI0019D4895A|nr:restriction endonuclease subunit S [Vibrio vulnificus]MBN8103971.1 restriction endonuclease subunit S [Vibrio vulnificus]